MADVSTRKKIFRHCAAKSNGILRNKRVSQFAAFIARNTKFEFQFRSKHKIKSNRFGREESGAFRIESKFELV